MYNVQVALGKKCNNDYNCVNNKMLENDWMLTDLIYALTGCFRYKLSDLTCPDYKHL